jgi:REP element-mobilizing transposase RayT
MSNPPPLLPGCYYHVYNRGNNRQNLFIEARNYAYFMKLYAYHVQPVADTFTYCLMRNHFHLLVRIQEGAQNPGQAFSNLFNAYAKAINHAYQRTGSLFQRPFGRIEITTNAHFTQLVAYIHQNPQKHGFVEDFRQWPYSSYAALISEKPTHLQRGEILGWFKGIGPFIAFHQTQVNPGSIAPLVIEE